MPPGENVNTKKLKKQLQSRTASRRARNQAETDVEAARSSAGRNDLQPRMPTVMKPIDTLVPSPNNARERTPQLVASIIRSFKKFGILLPILIDRSDTIVVGHGMWEAARKLGLKQVECRVIGHLDPVEIEAAGLAINRIGEIGQYDLEKLRASMIRIESAGIELVSTGFTLPEIGQIMIKPKLEQEGEDDGERDDGPVIAQLGDLFALGDHRVLCADSVDEASYKLVLGNWIANCVFADPPYNCPIKGFVGGLGKHQHDDFVQFAGRESDAEFLAFLTTTLRHGKTFASEGAVLFIAMDWRMIHLLLRAADEAGLTRINFAVWNKGSGGMGSLYRSTHELIPVFCNGKSPAVNNVALGVHGRDRTNVWTFAGANRRGSSASKALEDHPTPKPVELVVEALLDVTNPGDVVLDPFLGSGTTIMAAEQCGRKACGIELDPKYVDRAIRRWEKVTGEDAIHIASGLTFGELAAERRGDTDSDDN